MNSAINRAVTAILLCVPAYTFSSTIARGDDWGCQVLLCISNPSGATQYAACRPPIERLSSHLARGRSFPVCSGVGFTAIQPRHQPYYCDAGFRLVGRSGGRGHGEVTCLSTQPRPVSNDSCRIDDSGGHFGTHGSARGEFSDGKSVCKALETVRPHVREQPRYIDLAIEGAGRHRVWF